MEKETFQQIIDICEQNTDTEGTLSDIRTKAKNRVIRYEWEEKYGIKLNADCRFAEYDYYRLDDYQFISYFKDGYYCYKNGYGRSISWSESNKQPVDEWIYSIGFSTGAYIFGDDYEGQQQLFQDFFEELRTHKPDYEDLNNHQLYWKVENAMNNTIKVWIYKDEDNILRPLAFIIPADGSMAKYAFEDIDKFMKKMKGLGSIVMAEITEIK